MGLNDKFAVKVVILLCSLKKERNVGCSWREVQTVLFQLIFLLFAGDPPPPPPNHRSENLNLYSTHAGYNVPFHRPHRTLSLSQTLCFPSTAKTDDRKTELVFLRSLLCFFSPRTSSWCSLWGVRKPGSVPFMPFTPGASRRQLSRSEHQSVCPRKRQQITRVVFYLTRQMSSMVPVGPPFVARSASPSLPVRQPSDGTGWALQDCSGLRSPKGEPKYREIWEPPATHSSTHAPVSHTTHTVLCCPDLGYETINPPTPLTLVPNVRSWDLQAALKGAASELAIMTSLY